MENQIAIFEKEIKMKLQMKTSSHSTEEQTLVKAFKYFDLNNSGSCEKDEFVKAISRIGITGFDEKEIAALFRYYDVDCSGAIDYKEFVGRLYSNHSMAKNLPPRDTMKDDDFSEEEAEQILLKIRQRLSARGVRGITNIARNFKIIDDNNSMTIDYEEFKKAIKDFRFGLNEHETKIAFAAFDESNSGDINYDEFLAGIRGRMNDFRRALVAQAFNILDKNGNQRIELDDIKQCYNARKHPDVINGKRNEDEVLLEFLETFESHHHYLEGITPDHIVSLEEFIDYYENVSMSIDDDAYFEVMMNNAWRMNTNTTYNNEKKGWKNEEEQKLSHKNRPPKRMLGKTGENAGPIRSKPPTREQQVNQRQQPTEQTSLKQQRRLSQPPQQRQQPKQQQQQEQTEDQYNDDDLLLQRVRAAIIKRGGKGIIGLGKVFKIYDDNGNKTLDIDEFIKAMKEYQLGLTEVEIKGLFILFDHDRQGTVNYDEFLRTIRGEMNETRKQIVRRAFAKMDVDHSGIIDINDVKGMYDTKCHPDVVSGKKKPDDVYMEFLDTFETHHSTTKGVRDRRVTIEEFIEYYNNVSMSIDSDEYFIEMMTRAWKLTKDPEYMKQKAWKGKDESNVQQQYQAQRHHHKQVPNARISNCAPYGIDNDPTSYEVSSQFKCKAGMTKTSSQANLRPKSNINPQQQQKPTLSATAKLSAILSQRGTRGIMSLRRSFMIYDDNGSRKIGIEELAELFREYRIDLTENEARELFREFDQDNSGFIDYDEFVQGLVGEMSPFRKSLVRQAFNAIDKGRTGRIDYLDVKRKFNAQNHPDVMTGKRTEFEILGEFLDNFEYHFSLLNTKEHNRTVSVEEFIDFYNITSSVIHNDSYFEKMMTAVWNFKNSQAEDMIGYRSD